jgi:hypothetical protein
MSDEFQDMWQGQNPEPFHMPLEVIRARAVKLQRRVKFRNFREYGAAALVLPFCIRWTWTLSNPVMRAGAGMMVICLLYVVYQLYKRGSSREIAGDCLEFHRRELERQRDAVSSVWRWYLGPMVPGLLVMTLGSLYHNNSIRHTWFVWVYLVVCGFFFYLVGKLNQRGARKLQEQIDELDRMR